MSFNLIDEIQKKSRAEWLEIPKQNTAEARDWIQRHPEQAFFAGIIGGIVFVLAFKVVMTIAVAAAMLFGVVYYIAGMERKSASQASPVAEEEGVVLEELDTEK